MKYNFDEIIDRRNTNCVKWDLYPEDVQCLWVADTDFAVCPEIIEAIEKRLRHPVLGYSIDSAELKEVICKRMAERYQWDVKPEEIIFVPGIVSGFNFAVRAFCKNDDSVIYQVPAYPPFIHAPENFELEGIPNDMVRKNGRWEVDFDRFEAQIKENTSLFILCNPQNPTGRLFSKEELERFGEICKRHHITICSDEIHSEIVLDGNKHTPIASINEDLRNRAITFIAPSKTFNIPGLSCSAAIVQDPEMREKFNKALAGLCSGVIGISQEAALAAYRDCGEWLDELLVYLTENRNFVLNYISEKMPKIHTTVSEATFLMWLDCSDLGIEGSPSKFFLEKARVALNEGAEFGKGYEKFVRLNLGTSRAMLKEALDKMAAALETI